MTAMTDMRTEYARTLVELGRSDPRIVVLGADTTDSLKTSSFGREFPGRLFNVGIAEANMVSVSAGLAAAGKTAFASTYAIFLPGRAVDQLRNNVAYPSRDGMPGLNVKIVSSHGGLSVGPDGGSHQQLEDVAIMRAIPNFRVLVPADSASVASLVRVMASEYGPFYMRMARSKTHVVHEEGADLRPGRAVTLRDGSDCTIAACGITVHMALEAARLLSERGVSCRVLDMFSVKPVDHAALERAARETGRIVTAEEHNVMGGMGSAVAESVSGSYPVPVSMIGARDAFGESARDSEIPALLEKHGITSVNIARAAGAAR
ncbi:MAG: transketolase family protein [Nitrosopumilus sp.]|nr:transketolase family protein [Nitrosopumilus sp.]CAI9830986.1 putative transketolase C-terminal section [Nitrosopumilaceae archaeon]MDA7943833.1 transketolase family protein [Nitrosopumilus sp.]MDA7944989.1 transketolase family protein [Nitrosopumilus sp.]MDA7953226.1 transketolase family protein [Nitrosopumilus sp.]